MIVRLFLISDAFDVTSSLNIAIDLNNWVRCSLMEEIEMATKKKATKKKPAAKKKKK
jgi:hypothetical protein